MPFSSSTMRLAVRRPIPGTDDSALVSPDSTVCASACGLNRPSMASARRGPMPLMLSSVSNVCRSSSVGNPNRVRLSSLTWSDVYTRTPSPTRPTLPTAVSGTCTRSVTPPTPISTQSAPVPWSVPLTDEINDETISYSHISISAPRVDWI